LAFSLPRIHQAPEDFEPPAPVDDDTFVRMYCALRAAFPAAELVLSTREPPELRDRLTVTCITQLSAGSSTAPGGYENGEPPDCPHAAGEQFPVTDRRSVSDVAAWLAESGFEVTWD
jgi:2-iminoacetate synthase